jgi:hypothetical protein
VSRVASLRLHYQASSLLPTRPSLRPALVLGSSRVCRLEVSLGIAAQVPTFRTKASRWPHAVFMPVAARSVSRPPSELRPRSTTGTWFWQRPYAFDTSATVHLRSSCQRSPDGLSRLFRNAHHPGHCAKAACGGLDPDPAIRVRGAVPHLLCSKAASIWLLHQSLLSAPSWRTVIGITHEVVTALLEFLVQRIEHQIRQQR